MRGALEDGRIYPSTQEVLVVEVYEGQSLTGGQVGGTGIAIEDLFLVVLEGLEGDKLPQNILRVPHVFDRRKIHVRAGKSAPIEGERGELVIIRPELAQIAEVAKAAQSVEDGPAFRCAKLTKLATSIEELRMASRPVKRWLPSDRAPGIGDAASPNVLPDRLRNAGDLSHHVLIRGTCL